ncbi:MAG: phage tail tip lysozyme [Candidatus Saccharimonadales bacterium]
MFVKHVIKLGKRLVLFIMLAILLCAGSQQTTVALTESGLQSIILGYPHYDPTETGICSAELDDGTRYGTAWAFFTGQKGLSDEATAGIMGNLEAESGIDPHNMQNTAPLPDGPELPTEPGPDGNPVPASEVRGKYGYGIAQWTSAGRQQNLINYARETMRSTGDMNLQLDFLWKELNENYSGVLAELQTPGVTIDRASYVFLSEFEIPLPFTDAGTEEQRAAEAANRLSKAQNIYDRFKGQVAAPGAPLCAVGGQIDLESTDTTHILCTNGTEDAGAADGYRKGKLIKIRLCRVGGTLVNSQLAGSIKQMLDDSAAAGVPLSINGSFRSMEGQIRVYRSWCERGGITPTPPPYPRPLNEYNRCPGAAPPGYSNHQQGLALDLECNGSVITRYYPQAKNDPCFKWLLSNAVRYNLYEFGKGENRDSVGYEAWHWSVDGG